MWQDRFEGMRPDQIIGALPRFGGAQWATHTFWTPGELSALRILVGANALLERTADILGRTPSSITWRCRDDHIRFPSAWKKARGPRPKTPRIKLALISAPVATLVYPYVTKARAETADLLLINDLVSRAYPDHMRADICQDIFLAMLEGKTTIEALQANKWRIREYVSRFRSMNMEMGGFALSLDEPLAGGGSRYDLISTEDAIWN
jgi:hypothetical protein